MKSLRRHGAFTLIELLMVMVVLAVIMAIVIPQFASRHQQSQEAALHSDLKIMRNAITAFQADTGFYPQQLSDLSGSTAPAHGYDSTGTAQSIAAADYKGPYLQSIPTDPVSKAAFTYSVASPTVGTISSSATGNGLDGTAYSGW